MSLKNLRSEVVAALGASIPTFDYLPERINPPVAIVSAGSPYIEQGDTYSHHTVRWDVTLVTSSQNNEKATDDLDDLLEASLKALIADGYTLETVTQPYALEANGALYPAIRITVSDTINL